MKTSRSAYTHFASVNEQINWIDLQNRAAVGEKLDRRDRNLSRKLGKLFGCGALANDVRWLKTLEVWPILERTTSQPSYGFSGNPRRLLRWEWKERAGPNQDVKRKGKLQSLIDAYLRFVFISNGFMLYLTAIYFSPQTKRKKETHSNDMTLGFMINCLVICSVNWKHQKIDNMLWRTRVICLSRQEENFQFLSNCEAAFVLRSRNIRVLSASITAFAISGRCSNWSERT